MSNRRRMMMAVDNTPTIIPISYTENIVGCVLKDGTIGQRQGGGMMLYHTYTFPVSGYDEIAITGRQFGYESFNQNSYPWGADACICVAYDENDAVLQYYQLDSATDYSSYLITLPTGTNYVKISGNSAVECNAVAGGTK